jgi:nucleoside phosphorylase
MFQANYRVVILTALPVEFKAVRSFLTDTERVKSSQGNVYEQGRFEANGRVWEVGIAEIGAGDSGAALQTERAIAFFDPQVVLFVGVAGGIKDVEIGHVVVSTKIYGYESGKAEEEFKPRPTIGISSFALEEEAKAEARSDLPVWLNRLPNLPEPVPKVWVGPIAVGEKVIASKKSSVYQFLHQNYGDALAVEMEGYGFLQAVQERRQRLSAIVVRGISDLIDNKNDAINQDHEDLRQEKASLYAGAFAFHLLSNFDPNESLISAPMRSSRVDSDIWDALMTALPENDVPLLATLFEGQLQALQRDSLGRLETLANLRAALERLDNLELAISWAGSIIQHFEQLPDGKTVRSVPLKLQAWYEQQRPSVPEAPPPPKSPGYLLISLDPKDDAGTVEFIAELHQADGTVQNDLLPRGTRCSVEKPDEASSHHEALSDLLSKVIEKASGIKTIEFFLSWQHLHKPVHNWRAMHGLVKEPLKNFRGTLIRSLDRVTLNVAQEWCETLEEQWTCLRCCQDADFVNRCHELTSLDCDDLQGKIDNADPGYLIFKLLTVLPEDPQDLRLLSNVLLRSGVPLWFWFYSAPDNVATLSKKIDELLTVNNLGEESTFAEVVRKKRKQLPDLGLLFDCPTRSPTLIGWKCYPMRSPAA